MHFIGKYKAHIIIGVCVAVLLCAAFFMGGAERTVKQEPPMPVASDIVQGEEKQITLNTSEPSAPLDEKKEVSAAPAQENTQKTQDRETEALPCCILSVRCDTALGNAGEKNAVLPQDGIIYAGQNVTFTLGESVFDVLQGEMKNNNIPIEFTTSPIYQSVYIEGINNLYERDCGNLSGWVYKVNGEAPGYDCSNYVLKAGDIVEWFYSCDLGRDV